VYRTITQSCPNDSSSSSNSSRSRAVEKRTLRQRERHPGQARRTSGQQLEIPTNGERFKTNLRKGNSARKQKSRRRTPNVTWKTKGAPDQPTLLLSLEKSTKEGNYLDCHGVVFQCGTLLNRARPKSKTPNKARAKHLSTPPLLALEGVRGSGYTSPISLQEVILPGRTSDTPIPIISITNHSKGVMVCCSAGRYSSLNRSILALQAIMAPQ